MFRKPSFLLFFLAFFLSVHSHTSERIGFDEDSKFNLGSATAPVGLSAVKEVKPSISTLIHIELGAQNSESEYFLDKIINRGVSFDAIGESYYPKWHGTLNELDSNLNLLLKKYKKPVIVAEYSEFKKQVNRIAFSLPGNQMKGTFIWEPLNTWESIFDKEGKANQYLYEYDDIRNEFIKNQN